MTQVELKKYMSLFIDELVDDNVLRKLHRKCYHEASLLSLELRMLTSLMSSFSIKQGYFFEQLIRFLLSKEEYIQIHETSGILSTPFACTIMSLDAIKQYCRADFSFEKLDLIFDQLLSSLYCYESQLVDNNKYEFNGNVDIAFFDQRIQQYYLIEMKMADNHVGSGYRELHSKYLQLYAGLLHLLPKNIMLRCIIYYFRYNRVQKSPYFPESVFYYGSQFFERFFSKIKYIDVLSQLEAIQKSREMRKITHKLQSSIALFLKQHSFPIYDARGRKKRSPYQKTNELYVF